MAAEQTRQDTRRLCDNDRLADLCYQFRIAEKHEAVDLQAIFAPLADVPLRPWLVSNLLDQNDATPLIDFFKRAHFGLKRLPGRLGVCGQIDGVVPVAGFIGRHNMQV